MRSLLAMLMAVALVCETAHAQEIAIIYPDTAHTAATDVLAAVEEGKSTGAWLVEIKPKERYTLDTVIEMHELTHLLYGEDHGDTSQKLKYQPCIVVEGNLYEYPESNAFPRIKTRRFCYRVYLAGQP